MKSIYIILLMGVSILTTTCKKERVMMISTGGISQKTAYTLTITGRVINTGKGAIQYGHMYANVPNATADRGNTSKFGVPEDGIEFTSQFVNLFPGIKYYIKAYITDGTTTVYGNETIFITPDCPGSLPVYVGSTIENPTTLEINYNVELANIVPPISSFTVVKKLIENNLIFLTKKTVSMVTISGTKVSLTLSDPIQSGEVINFKYEWPDYNHLQTPSGCRAESLLYTYVPNHVNP
jgi:hypothetical protein